MAATVDTKIWMALKTRIILAARELPVAWPAEPFTPPTTTAALLPFLAVGDVASSTRVMISSTGAQERTGIVTMAYVDTLGYTHEYYMQKAGEMLQWFPVDGVERFEGVCVRFGNGPSVPRLDRGYRDGGYYRTPILIPWRCAA